MRELYLKKVRSLFDEHRIVRIKPPPLFAKWGCIRCMKFVPPVLMMLEYWQKSIGGIKLGRCVPANKMRCLYAREIHRNKLKSH